MMLPLYATPPPLRHTLRYFDYTLSADAPLMPLYCQR